jgi:CheY-like chemotaxis protein
MIRVLVVDDDFRVADLHARFVARIPGFEVVGVAHTAVEAVELAARAQPDLALLDQYLPDAKGTAIAPQLGCDVIMLTAAADSGVVRDALGRAVVNYLVKPFSEADLAERLRAYAFSREAARRPSARPGRHRSGGADAARRRPGRRRAPQGQVQPDRPARHRGRPRRRSAGHRGGPRGAAGTVPGRPRSDTCPTWPPMAASGWTYGTAAPGAPSISTAGPRRRGVDVHAGCEAPASAAGQEVPGNTLEEPSHTLAGRCRCLSPGVDWHQYTSSANRDGRLKQPVQITFFERCEHSLDGACGSFVVMKHLPLSYGQAERGSRASAHRAA